MKTKIALIALGVLALFSTSRLASLIFYILAALAALCYFGGYWVFEHLRVERRLSSSKAFIGQEVTVTLRARNEARFPLGWICLCATKQPNLTFAGPLAGGGLLARKGVFTFAYKIAGAKRGCHSLGEIRVAGGDPLGWYERRLTIRDPGDVLTVYPRITPLDGIPLPGTQPFGKQRDALRAHEDPTRLAGVRDYQPGDGLRRIHWRASARQGTLQVKEFVPTVTAESIILLNLREDDYPLESWWDQCELAVETAASLVVHLAGLETSFGLVANGRDPAAAAASGAAFYFPPAVGPAQAEAILTLLARITVGPAPDFTEPMGIHGRNAIWGTCLYLITPVWHEGMTRTALSLARLGMRPVIMLLEARDLRQAASAGLSTWLVRRSRERGEVAIVRGR